MQKSVSVQLTYENQRDKQRADHGNAVSCSRVSGGARLNIRWDDEFSHTFESGVLHEFAMLAIDRGSTAGKSPKRKRKNPTVGFSRRSESGEWIRVEWNDGMWYEFRGAALRDLALALLSPSTEKT